MNYPMTINPEAMAEHKDKELAEIRLNDALQNIKSIDGQIAELQTSREMRRKQLAETLQELQKLVEKAHHVLAPATNDHFGEV